MLRKLAIVDDDSIFQFTTKVKIEKLGLAEDIQIFSDGEEMFNYLQENDGDQLPEVILLDINMPIADGWDFLEMYKQISPGKKQNIKIFMLSSSINPIDVEKAEKHPEIVKYITKPIKDEVLHDILG